MGASGGSGAADEQGTWWGADGEVDGTILGQAMWRRTMV